MPRPNSNLGMDLMIPGKIRKRGCSSSASSSSSIIQNYRFKRAILVGKRGGSSTPVPTWKLMSSRSPTASALRAMDSPNYSQNGGARSKQQQPVSARKLAATLWEMNDMPSPRVKEGSDERRLRKMEARNRKARERERIARSAHSGSLPPHLSDPSHSPVSERMDRSGTGSFHRRASPISQRRLRLTDHHAGMLDSHGNGSLMEVETRSRAQTPNASTAGAKTRLKDVSNSLTTSKELLKIINCVWGNEDRPSSSMALISALHAELERARLQVNQLIQEQRSDQNEINYLMKCFAEEKAAWKSKEHKVVEAAIEAVAGELEVEKRLRGRFESMNKKLRKELAETKASLVNTAKELEGEKRTREIMEQVCDELARDVTEDKDEAEEMKRESAKVRDEVEKEREMMLFADLLREERAQVKLSEAKHLLEEKNAAVDMLRSQLEAFMGSKATKEKGRSSTHLNDEEISAYLSKAHLVSCQDEERDEDEGEVEDGVECEEDSAESDLHSIELSMGNNSESYNLNHTSAATRDPRWAAPYVEEIKGSKCTSGKPPRRSTSLQRSISDGVEWGMQTERLQNSGDGIDWERFPELERQRQRQGKGCANEMQGHKSSRGIRDQMLSGSRLGHAIVHASPTQQWGQPWPSRDPTGTFQDRPPSAQGSGSKSRLGEVKDEGQNGRRYKRRSLLFATVDAQMQGSAVEGHALRKAI